MEKKERIITNDLIDNENYYHGVISGPKALEAISYKSIEDWGCEMIDLHPDCLILYQGYDFGLAELVFNEQIIKENI
jgi:hypothetical protein